MATTKALAKKRAKPAIQADKAEEILNAFELLIDEDALAWWETHGTIRLKNGDIIKPAANVMQVRIAEIMAWCRENGRACRILILKPRQKGASTYSVAELYHASATKSINSMIIGDIYQQSKNLMSILGRYANGDTHFGVKSPVTVKEDFARWKNGSFCRVGTAQNADEGRSGTYQFLLATEVARWAEAGVANAGEVLSGLLKCVGNVPGTTIVLESTARGASGDFYERWQGAITFEEFQAGRDGYVKVFAPWFAFDDSTKVPATEGIMGVEDLTVDEKDYMDMWGSDLGQMAWRRWAIKEECKRDPEQFEQDYPTTAESAFLMSGRRRFNAKGLKRLREMTTEREPIYGILDGNSDGRVVHRVTSTSYEAMCWVWERPTVGLRYSLIVDPAGGRSRTTNADPDHHGPLVLRDGYYDTDGWHPPAVVARLASMTAKGPECRWDIDVLEYEVWKLARYFGDCLIVVENNMDCGLIELLRKRGANLYVQQVFNRLEMKTTDMLGWRTTTETRGVMVEAVAAAVREVGTIGGGLNCWDPWLVTELENFITKSNGRVEAADNYHDDQVIALAIGLCTKAMGTVFSLRKRERGMPADLLELMNQRSENVMLGYR